MTLPCSWRIATPAEHGAHQRPCLSPRFGGPVGFTTESPHLCADLRQPLDKVSHQLDLFGCVASTNGLFSFPRLGADGLSYHEMDHLQELNTGSLCASAHATSGLCEDLRAPCSKSIHISSHCLEEKIPAMFELLSKRLRATDWLDSTRISTLINMFTAGDWSANSMSHGGEFTDLCPY